MTIPLRDGSRLQLLPAVPPDAAGRRLAVQHATLYGFFGTRIDIPGHFIGGYVGKTETFASTRAGTSWTHWVISQKAITPTGMALVFSDRHGDQLALIESRVIQRLSCDLGMLALTNTHTSAEKAAARLSSVDLQTGIRLADQIALNIWVHGLHSRSNSWPAPSPNAREAAARIVFLASTIERRAVSTWEIVERLNASGHPSNGKTRWRSVLRDLRSRERDSLCPRVHALTHRGRVLYHHTTLPAADAIHGYDQHHPVRSPGRNPPSGSPT